MTKSILKAVGKGLLIGTILFFAPGFVLAFLGIMLIMKFFFYRKFKKHGAEYRFAYADKIRSMSDEEYQDHKTNFKRRGYC